MSSVEVRNNFSEAFNRTAFGKERIVVTRRGRPLAALVPIDDLEFLIEAEDRVDLELARRALKEAEVSGTVAWDEVRRKLGLAD